MNRLLVACVLSHRRASVFTTLCEFDAYELLCQVVASAIVDKYIGESARLIREMFGYARDHQPCIIFMDEVQSLQFVSPENPFLH